MNRKELIKRSHDLMKVDCSECKGVGVKYSADEDDYTNGLQESEYCDTCNGTGIKPVNISKKLMAIITNLCKALECWENGKRFDLKSYNIRNNKYFHFKSDKEKYKQILNVAHEIYRKGTFEDHLASVFIGLFDLLSLSSAAVTLASA